MASGRPTDPLLRMSGSEGDESYQRERGGSGVMAASGRNDMREGEVPQSPVMIRRASSGGTQFMRQVSTSGLAAFGMNVGGADDDEPMFPCQVCFMDKLESDRYVLPDCNHSAGVCRDCFRAHVRYEINDAGRVEGITCPCSNDDDSECTTKLSDDDIRANVDDDTWARVERLRALREDDSSRECPFGCKHVQKGDRDDPIMECGGCGKSYCFFHANAHEPSLEACRKYKMDRLKDEQQTAALLDEIAMRCPGCERPVEKNRGCNHMTCSSCGTEFCWLCGSVITGQVAWHYGVANPAGCPGMMMTDGLKPGCRREQVKRAYAEQFTCCGRFKLFLRGIFLLLMTPFVIALAAVFAGLFSALCVMCCCCVSIAAIASGEEEAGMAVLGLILAPIVPIIFIPLYIAGALQVMFMSCASRKSIEARTAATRPDQPGAPAANSNSPLRRFAERGGYGVVEDAEGGMNGAAAPSTPQKIDSKV